MFPTEAELFEIKSQNLLENLLDKFPQNWKERKKERKKKTVRTRGKKSVEKAARALKLEKKGITLDKIKQKQKRKRKKEGSRKTTS